MSCTLDQRLQFAQDSQRLQEMLDRGDLKSQTPEQFRRTLQVFGELMDNNPEVMAAIRAVS